MIRREIQIGEKKIPFKASAAVPRLYRALFQRDIFRDMVRLEERMEKGKDTGEGMTYIDLELFENVAYTMARHADPSIPKTADEWLEGFDVFSIYEILPKLVEMWGINMETQVIAKKNIEVLTGK